MAPILMGNYKDLVEAPQSELRHAIIRLLRFNIHNIRAKLHFFGVQRTTPKSHGPMIKPNQGVVAVSHVDAFSGGHHHSSGRRPRLSYS